MLHLPEDMKIKHTEEDVTPSLPPLSLSSGQQSANIPRKCSETDVSMTTDKHHRCQVTARIHGNLVCSGI